MSAWIRFVNKTNFNVIELEIDESEKHFPVYKNIPSRYKYSAGGTTRLKIFSKNSLILDTVITTLPSKLNTVILT